MIRKYFLLLLAVFFIAIDCVSLANNTQCCTCNVPDFTTGDKVIIGGLLGGAIIIAAPYVLAAGSTIKIAVAIKLAVAAGSTYLIPTTTVGQVGLGLMTAQIVRPFILQTTEERLDRLLGEKASMPARAKAEFISCLKENGTNCPRNAFGRPTACEAATHGICKLSISSCVQKTLCLHLKPHIAPGQH